MIRQANEQDFAQPIMSESAVRIHALKIAYGQDAPFVRFYADGEGALASIMDGFCVFHCTKTPNEEWLSFLHMHADVRIIHTDGALSDLLSVRLRAKEVKLGEVLGIENVSSETSLHTQTPSIAALHAFLKDNFDKFSPFEQWYVDVSHRVRHGCCHIAAIQREGTIVSSAMSVAETPLIALIGGVATAASHRGKGLASKCIFELLAMLPQARILINPVDEYASRLYKKLGFKPYGTWTELVLP
ncbi:MAG: GNAT family N-acetyltransferase [Clostridia bacterium]|nr:GNAT family N-acetyltransferase [Clostridia bacterium]